MDWDHQWMEFYPALRLCREVWYRPVATKQKLQTSCRISGILLIKPRETGFSHLVGCPPLNLPRTARRLAATHCSQAVCATAFSSRLS